MDRYDSEVPSRTAHMLRHLDLINMVRLMVGISFTFALLEIIATLSDEIALVWPARISPMKVLYFVNKYSPCIDLTIVSFLQFEVLDTQSCMNVYTAAAHAILFGSLVSELILLGRTWALWRFDRRIIALTTVMMIGIVAFAISTIEKALLPGPYRYVPPPVLRVAGCMPAIHDQGTWPAFACLILGETGIIFITLVRMWYDRRDVDGFPKGTLHQTMYWDAAAFFLVVLAVSVVNLIVMIVAPPELGPIFHLPLRTVHSAMCTRVLINLRKAAAHMSKPALSEFTMDTTLAFRSIDVSSAHSLESGELEHCGYRPRHLGFLCSSSESANMRGSASEMGTGQ